MSAIFIMVGASLLLAIGFLIAFIWSVKSNQYEDDYTPSVRMLFDNTTIQKKSQEINNQTKTTEITTKTK
jgi:cbb3-type cytochrome oxidase maturation protein